MNTANGDRTQTSDELTTLQNELTRLRDELNRVSADRDAYCRMAQELHVKRHPLHHDDFHAEKLIPVPAGTPDLISDVLRELEGVQ